MTIHYRKDNYGKYTDFHAISDVDSGDEDEHLPSGTFPHGTVTVQNSSERIARHLLDPSFRPHEMPGQQMSFFEGEPAKIDYALVDHRLGKGVASTLLALAYNHAKSGNPRNVLDASPIDIPVNTKLPTYSSSLSKNSSPIVQKALQANLVTPNPHNKNGELTNSIGQNGSYKRVAGKGDLDMLLGSFGSISDVSPEEMSAARNLVRNTVRSLRDARHHEPVSETPQYEQLKLDGM